ncbi:transposase-like protein [Rhizobium sp. BK313]|nr:transposase-like protein [Rhizobium sp. BK313]
MLSFPIMVDFKGSHYPKDVILYAVFFYVRYAVSYRDLEEIMAERGVVVDHATLNRWVVKYAPLIACEAQRRKCATSSSWRMDETYIQVKGKCTYFFRAVDKFGKTLDFMLSEHRDEAAASAFFAPLDQEQWLARKGRHRQEWCEPGRIAKHQLVAAVAWMVLADRDPAGQIPQ